jgi:hypothetical protein
LVATAQADVCSPYCLTVIGRSYRLKGPETAARFGSRPTIPCEDSNHGLARPACLSTTENRKKAYPVGTDKEPISATQKVWGLRSTGQFTDIQRAPTREVAPSTQGNRRWGLGGFRAPDTNPYTHSFVFLWGWRGGRGPEDCERSRSRSGRRPRRSLPMPATRSATG